MVLDLTIPMKLDRQFTFGEEEPMQLENLLFTFGMDLLGWWLHNFHPLLVVLQPPLGQSSS